MNANDIISLWEVTSHKPYWQKGVLMLAAAHPDIPMDELAYWSIGKRNMFLFRLRDQIFGTHIEAHSECPACAEKVEFQLDSNIICDPTLNCWDGNDLILNHEEEEVAFRIPHSFDMKSIVSILEIEGEEAASEALIIRCIKHYKKGSSFQRAEQLPAEWIAKVSDAINEYDTHSDIRCRLQCPECGHSWAEGFDIVNFFHNEIDIKARMILSEVQALASAFGWWEGDILSLSDTRRKHYLEALNG